MLSVKILFVLLLHQHLLAVYSIFHNSLPSGSPTSPGNLQVVSEVEREVTLIWEPSFLPFDILPPRYKVYVDDNLEANVEEPSFVFSREEHSCDAHMIRVEAYNEVGSSASEHREVVLPAGVCHTAL